MPAALTSRSNNRLIRSVGEAFTVLRWPSLLGWPMGVSVAGWGLMWADALALVDVGSAWIPVALFVLGLALIPLASSAPRRARTAGYPFRRSRPLHLPEYRGDA